MADALASWHDGDAKASIREFVTGAATPGDGFIEPADRIAVFDNDGTLRLRPHGGLVGAGG